MQAKVELGKVVSGVDVSSKDKVGASRGAETNALLPRFNLIGLEVPIKWGW